MLCDAWNRDLIFGKHVNAKYVKESINPFKDLQFETMDFLKLNNGFLTPVTKAKDGHYVNAIHLLEYCDYIKVPGYNLHCSSLDRLTYLRLCCPECKKFFPILIFLTNHKRLRHPANRGRKPKRLFKQNSFDDCSVLPLHEVQVRIVLGEKEYMSN
ncbi:5285_t:CDS:2 [Gigaspora rosea]|nr:5285_t:CDS:2 [Gigaspora rosea]